MDNTEGNILIAKYQGAKIEQWYSEIKDYEQTGKHAEYPKEGIYPDNQRYHPVDCLKYHKDWNWIIPVVKKVKEEIGQLSTPGNEAASREYRDKAAVWIWNSMDVINKLEIGPLWDLIVSGIELINESKEHENKEE